MKILISIYLLFFPILVLAEYNNLHIEFEIQLTNGSKIHGYQYLPHGTNTEAFKKHLEENPKIYLKSKTTLAQGNYGYYKRRLEYLYENKPVYKLIEQQEITLNEIKSVVIKDLITGSYLIQISGNYQWKDRLWMNSKPIIQYSEDEDMCTYNVFIHQSGTIPEHITTKIKSIIALIDTKIKTKEKDHIFNSDLEYQEHMKDLYEERSRLLKPILNKYKHLKIVNISLCSC